MRCPICFLHFHLIRISENMSIQTYNINQEITGFFIFNQSAYYEFGVIRCNEKKVAVCTGGVGVGTQGPAPLLVWQRAVSYWSSTDQMHEAH